MNKYKALVFDVDSSLSTIGGRERQQEVFGLPAVPWSGSASDLGRKLVGDIVVANYIKDVDPLLGDLGETMRVNFKDKFQEAGVNMLIIDTLTMLGSQERAQIIKESKGNNLDMQGWGMYALKMEQLINMLSKCEFPVIITGHVKRKEDEFGRPIEVPDLKGSIENAAGRYFDVIAYSKVEKNAANNVRKYNWIVSTDSRYVFAKNRGDFLPPVIPQDLSFILNTYKEKGVHNPKILILGDTGNGKSWSLQTINNNTQQLNED